MTILNVWLGVAFILCLAHGVHDGYTRNPDGVDDLEANLMTVLTWPLFLGILIGALMSRVRNVIRRRT